MAINWEKVEEQAKARDTQQYNAMKADTKRLNAARSTTSNTSGTLQKAARQQPISGNLRRDSLLDALLNDPSHINEVVDSTTGQVIHAEKPSALGRTVTGALKSTASGFVNALGTTQAVTGGVIRKNYLTRDIEQLQNDLARYGLCREVCSQAEADGLRAVSGYPGPE